MCAIAALLYAFAYGGVAHPDAMLSDVVTPVFTILVATAAALAIAWLILLVRRPHEDV